MNIDEIITALREQGFCLELCSTVRDVEAMYSARFVPEDCEVCSKCDGIIPNNWNEFEHADTFEEVIKLALEAVKREIT